MNSSKTLGPVMMAPTLVFVLLFFLLPVVMTAVFSFTNMSTATGISNGTYQITPSSLRRLSDEFAMPAIANQLKESRYTVDKLGLDALHHKDVDNRFINQVENNLLGENFKSRRELSRSLKNLGHSPRSTREINTLADSFQRSVGTTRYSDSAAMLQAVTNAGIELDATQQNALIKASYTGWVWTTENYRRMESLPDTQTALSNTLIYVFTTLTLFNIGFALVLALATHYMPKRTAGFYRAVWLLPRITPPVLYVLLWKWLAWDTGFISNLLSTFGVPAKNWMLDTPTHAWTFIVLINGFVGASMGMLVLSSAINAIPKSHFWASEVDGANRWQQIRHIILPQLRWPILFMTCYQTLSLLASFDYILLATGGGPGGTTEVWALRAYNTALSNYAGNLQYGYGAALAMVLVGIGLIMSIVYLKLFGFKKMVAKPRIEI
ncbi:ABC transporter permease [Photobacterium profundum]|uniref:Sugar ABC transporter, permease protein n=1 Tax=Photobacterium profundum 3TCK TaxID=314280 RepID=Q1ZBB4_9GAMM|nr:sugar ABC transporter permease [Photobacterium profundum]EAS45228.1 sugar ABC transporter, permease protein [Photobacterium profundum 3TCK]PSV63570.1 ABC transporter permease [Photobacterium profundum]